MRDHTLHNHVFIWKLLCSRQKACALLTVFSGSKYGQMPWYFSQATDWSGNYMKILGDWDGL